VNVNVVVVILLVPALVTALWVVASSQRAILAAVAISILLPFAVVPVRLIATPSILEILLATSLFGWLLAMIRSGAAPLPPLRIPLILLVGTLTAAFVAGWDNGYSTDIVHNYFKLLLAIFASMAVAGAAKANRFPVRFLRVVSIAGLAAAVIGLALYLMEPDLAANILKSLAAVGYPTERVLRYVEDNPSLGLRATGTSVDPNSFGGMLALLVPLVASQLLARKPWVPRYLALACLLTMVACLLLSRSRAAWLGATAGLVLIATIEYRRLWLPIVATGLAVSVLGVGNEFVQRLYHGLALQDPATLMRLREYSDAIAIISRYPVLGIGFGPAPDPDLRPGVSSIYLTVAEQAGLLGLTAYVLLVGAALWTLIKAWTLTKHSELGSIALGLLAGTVSALTIGMLDHYFMNPQFSHMAFMLWSFPAVASALPSWLQVHNREVIHPIGGAVITDPSP
jgi:O-antigen ligase